MKTRLTAAAALLTMAFGSTAGRAASTTITPGPSSFEVRDDRISIRKDIQRGRSVTTITSPTDQIVLTIDRVGITVSTRTAQRTALLTRPEEMSGVVGDLAGRPIVAEAVALLSHESLDPASPKGRALGLTRALLETVDGDVDAPLGIAEWAHRPLPPAAAEAVPARAGTDPGACWDQYSRDAIRAANDYVDCYNSTHWYNFIDRAGCGLVYDVEAEGDWIWYWNCVGIPFPSVRVG
jgi:hypothetical protein